MSMFSGIESAQVTQGGNYIKPGKFLLRVNTLKTHRSQQKNADMFISELDVVESTCGEQPAGSSVCWIASFQHLSALGNVKAFLAAAAGVKTEHVDEAGCLAAVSPQQPLHGKLIRAEAFNIKTKEKNTDFTRVNWFEVPAEIQAQAAQIAQAVGLAPF